MVTLVYNGPCLKPLFSLETVVYYLLGVYLFKQSVCLFKQNDFSSFMQYLRTCSSDTIVRFQRAKLYGILNLVCR